MAATLTDAQAAIYRQRFIVSGIREGLSANTIISNLTTAGLGQRRSTLLDQIRQFQEGGARLPRLPSTPLTEFLPDNLTINYHTSGKERYQYVYSVPATDIATGEAFDITYSITSPIRLVPDLANALASQNVDFEGNYNATPDLSGLDLLAENRFTLD